MPDTLPLEVLRVTGYAALGLGDVAVSRARSAADDARVRARTGVTRARARIEGLPADLVDLGGTLTAEDFLRLAQSYLASTRRGWSGLVVRGRDTYTRLAGPAPDVDDAPAPPSHRTPEPDTIPRSA